MSVDVDENTGKFVKQKADEIEIKFGVSQQSEEIEMQRALIFKQFLHALSSMCNIKFTCDSKQETL